MGRSEYRRGIIMVKKIFTREPVSIGYVVGRANNDIGNVAINLGYNHPYSTPSGDSVFKKRIRSGDKYCDIEVSQDKRGLPYSSVTIVGYGNDTGMLRALLDAAINSFSVESLPEERLSADSIRLMDALCGEMLAEETARMN